MSESSCKSIELKKFEDLDFTDDFMFCRVLEYHPEICRELAELITGRKVTKIVSVEKQKPIKPTSDGKGVRFDVYFSDEGSRVYDFEMQNQVKKNLPRRTRYYQSMVDFRNLKRGIDYKELPDSYIVFICMEDPYEESYYRYTFEETCSEKPSLKMGDGAWKIFINAKGTEGDVPEDLKEFLNYLVTKKPGNRLTKEIDAAVQEARKDEEWRNDYMFLSEMYESAEEKGKENMANQVIDNMLRDNLSIEKICAYSGKSKDYIEARKKALKDSTLVGA